MYLLVTTFRKKVWNSIYSKLGTIYKMWSSMHIGKKSRLLDIKYSPPQKREKREEQETSPYKKRFFSTVQHLSNFHH